jgi:hypothetical protein
MKKIIFFYLLAIIFSVNALVDDNDNPFLVGGNIPVGGPAPVAKTDPWERRFDADGKDRCATNPNLDVCACPCDSDFIKITGLYRGGRTCLNADEMLNDNPGQAQGRSQKFCGTLGFAPFDNDSCGSVKVCDSSIYPSNSDKCAESVDPNKNKCPDKSSGMTFAEAEQYCSNAGMRLCSADEVLRGVLPTESSCGLGEEYVWTGTRCTTEKCTSTTTQYQVMYSRPTSTPYGTPHCVEKASSSFRIGKNNALRKVYPACCADTRSDTPVWVLKHDDVAKDNNNGKCGFRDVDTAGWSNSGRMAFQAEGTGHKVRFSQCSGATERNDIDCRSMHGPFTGSTTLSKTFSNLGSHSYLRVSVRVWANDLWQAGSGNPLRVRVDGSEKFSITRTSERECTGNKAWETYNNADGLNGYMFEPGKDAWSEAGGAICFHYVTVTFAHTNANAAIQIVGTNLNGNNLALGDGCQTCTNGLNCGNNWWNFGPCCNPEIPACWPSAVVPYQYFGFDQLQLYTSSVGTLVAASLNPYQWGDTTKRCPGADCTTKGLTNCLTWPGANADFARAMRFCSGTGCDAKTPSASSHSACNAATGPDANVCIPSPYGNALSVAKCTLCPNEVHSDFWCARDSFKPLTFRDPLRCEGGTACLEGGTKDCCPNPVNDPTKNRELTLMRVTAFGSLGVDGTTLNSAQTQLNTGGAVKTLDGRGVDDAWQCNDCFESSVAEFSESEFTAYKYHPNAGWNSNQLTVGLPTGRAWCISRVEIRMCARPGKPEITNIVSVDGSNKDDLSPTLTEKIKFIGVNLGPLVQYLSYGPAGEGYTLDNPSAQCDPPQSPYTELTCRVLPGIGQNHKWKIKTNKVEESALSTVTTSYSTPGAPTLSPSSVITSGSVSVTAGAGASHLELLGAVGTASAKLIVDGAEVTSSLAGNSLIFFAPVLATRAAATNGVPVQIKLEIVDSVYGTIGEATSSAVQLFYDPPTAAGVEITFVDDFSTVELAVEGSNFGQVSAVGDVTVCKSIDSANATCETIDTSKITRWNHNQVKVQFTNGELKRSYFPGNITITVGNRKTAAKRISLNAPKITGWEGNVELLFPTAGGEGGNVSVRVENFQLSGNDNNEWFVRMGGDFEKKLFYCSQIASCLSGGWLEIDRGTDSNVPYTDVMIVVPPGQGTQVPFTFESVDGEVSNAAKFGGYLPPVLVTIYKGSEVVGSQASGQFNSKSRPGVDAIGSNVNVVGMNLGFAALREWCDVPEVGCKKSPTECCDGRWKRASSAGNQNHTHAQASIPAGIGVDHLLRVVVGGQPSNAVAMRYMSPKVTKVFNQSLPTSATPDSDTSPGVITIIGEHFGMIGLETSARYSYPIIMVGPSVCPIIPASWKDNLIQCQLPAGQGANLPVNITVGTQFSEGVLPTYAYAPPKITFGASSTLFGLTDGSTSVSFTGENFGTAAADLLFQFVRSPDNAVFDAKVDSDKHTHVQVGEVKMPEGQGGNISLRVSVNGQPSNQIQVIPGVVDATNVTGYEAAGVDVSSIDLSGPYLPPLLKSISPQGGPSSGCKVFEDKNKWKARFAAQGGTGRSCTSSWSITISGLSLGKSDVSALMLNEKENKWEVFASDAPGSKRKPMAHSHTSIELPAPMGLGTARRIKLVIGGVESKNEVLYNFDPPRSLEVEPVPFDARGSEPIKITAEDGLGEELELVGALNISIGGLPCQNPIWLPINPDDGRPYLTCTPQPDVAGSKDLNIFVSSTWTRIPANKSVDFNSSTLFSVCKAGETNLTSGFTQTYYGRPCRRNDTEQSYFHSAPCVGSESGVGELCVECPAGAICNVPGTPWPGNRGRTFTYYDPTARKGFFRIERSIKDQVDLAEIQTRIDKRRWNDKFLKNFPDLYQRDKVFDFVPCLPSEACVQRVDNDTKIFEECDVKYRFVKEQCQVWNENNPTNMNCTTDLQCQTRSGYPALSGDQCESDRPEDCAVCDMTQASSDGVGTCRCMPPKRCGRCTLPATYPNGVEVKGHFMLDGECKQCPQNIGLIIAMFVIAVIGGAWGASYLNRNKVNLAFASIGVDYFQVLAIFRGANIPWPEFLTAFFRFFAFFNLNIDIAAPECLDPNLGYALKFIITEIMPLCVLAFIIFYYIFERVGRKLCPGLFRRDNKADWRSYISIYMITLNFLYLVVTRKAFQIFNCNPPTPTDGWFYTTFSDPSCPLGLCRCYDSALHEETKDFFHRQFIAPAALAIVFYTIGFPLVVAFVVLKNKGAIKEDQYLRILGLGDTDTESTPKAWSVRLKYYQLYYYFRPGKVYWLLWILYRKASIAIIATVFYSNPGFQLAFTILILFSSYVMQVRSRPYLSQSEKAREIAAHNERVEKGDEKKVHLEREIKRLKDAKAKKEHEAHARKKRIDFSRATTHTEDAGTGLGSFFFDYNTIELLLLGCSIFICAAGIMFVSGQFEGGRKNQSVILEVAVLVVIMFSMIYYGMVCIFELFDTRNWTIFNRMMRFFASKLDNLYKDTEQDRTMSIELQANPMLNIGSDKLLSKDEEIDMLKRENAKKDETVSQLMSDLKAQKQTNMRGGDNDRKGRVKRQAKKQEFAQEMVVHQPDLDM